MDEQLTENGGGVALPPDAMDILNNALNEWYPLEECGATEAEVSARARLYELRNRIRNSYRK